MDIIKLVIDIVKDVGPKVRKYVDYQICHSDYVRKFEEMQGNLRRRHNDINAKLMTQQAQPGQIPCAEVEDWLNKADPETVEKAVEDSLSKWGCFTYICSSRKLDKKTQELHGIFRQGEIYTHAGQSLVIDDHSIEHCRTAFKEKQEQLKCRQKDIEATLETQRRQPGKIARQEVEGWIEKASQQIAIKVEDLISQGECSSSSNLEKKTEELKRLLEEGQQFTNDGVSLVVDDHSNKGVPLPVECSGRHDIQEKILEWLKGDKVTRIAVSGMGGVGKTTIMKQVHNQLLKESKFNKVIWLKVSNNFDIIVQQKKGFDILKFQKSIAGSLGLELKPHHESESQLAGLISQELGQGSYVLILDDVWQEFSPKDVGILDLVGNNGCKVVLTTRLQDVACAMQCNVILVNPLPPEEALALFLEKVGSEMLSDGKIERDIETSLKQILQKCGGVPLAILTVAKSIRAKSMRGKLLSYQWKLVLSEFSKFGSIDDCLKFSFDCLEQQCQECFLYCALYPEDHEIPKEELIEYWIEEGLIYEEGQTREAMNWKGHGILDKLVDNCLLELLKNEDEEDRVSMHDLLREMALKISPRFLVKAGMALEKLPKEHEWKEDLLKVSLMGNYSLEIPSSMPSPKCPMLTTLLLSRTNISTISEAFFEHMLGLKILDLSWNLKLSRLPSSISKLEKLTTLLLGDCWSLREVPSLSNLVGLKKLDLFGTSIEELPEGLNMLTNLKYLGLGVILLETLDEQLQNLSKLQHLILATKTSELEKIGIWGRLPNLEKLVLQGFNKLKEVFGEIGAVATSATLPAGTFSYLHTIEIHNCEQLEQIIGFESERRKEVTLPKLERLRLTCLARLKSICRGPLICDSIKSIEVSDCSNIESIFWSGFNPLPNLECLNLMDLPNLESVFNEEALALSPPLPLKKIRVIRCGQLRILLSERLLCFFQSLETIEVEACSRMEMLIPLTGSLLRKNLIIPNLRNLRLTSLPALEGICNRPSVLICNSIQSLRISECEKLKRIPLDFPLLKNAQLSHPPSPKEMVLTFPLNFPLLKNAQSSHPPSLKEIVVYPKEWWESLEWDKPDAKDILLPFCKFLGIPL